MVTVWSLISATHTAALVHILFATHTHATSIRLQKFTSNVVICTTFAKHQQLSVEVTMSPANNTSIHNDDETKQNNKC